MRKSWAVLTFAVVVASSALGQTTNLKTALAGTFINPPNSPVEILSITQNGTDLLSQVRVKNNSAKSVTHLQLAAVFGVPNGCISGKFQQHHFESQDRPVDIAPGKTSTLSSIGLDPRSEWHRASNAGAAFVHWQVAVTRVEYSDGSNWQIQVTPGEVFSKEDFASVGRTSCTPQGMFKAVGRCTPRVSQPSITPVSLINPEIATAAGPSVQAQPDTGCWWFCQAYDAAVICKNAIDSCTMQGCTKPTQCAHQQCVLGGCP